MGDVTLPRFAWRLRPGASSSPALRWGRPIHRAAALLEPEHSVKRNVICDWVLRRESNGANLRPNNDKAPHKAGL